MRAQQKAVGRKERGLIDSRLRVSPFISFSVERNILTSTLCKEQGLT